MSYEEAKYLLDPAEKHYRELIQLSMGRSRGDDCMNNILLAAGMGTTAQFLILANSFGRLSMHMVHAALPGDLFLHEDGLVPCTEEVINECLAVLTLQLKLSGFIPADAMFLPDDLVNNIIADANEAGVVKMDEAFCICTFSCARFMSNYIFLGGRSFEEALEDHLDGDFDEYPEIVQSITSVYGTLLLAKSSLPQPLFGDLCQN